MGLDKMSLEEKLEPYKELEKVELRVKGSYEISGLEEKFFDESFRDENFEIEEFSDYKPATKIGRFFNSAGFFIGISGLLGLTLNAMFMIGDHLISGEYAQIYENYIDIFNSVSQVSLVSLYSGGALVLAPILYDYTSFKLKKRVKEKQVDEIKSDWSDRKTDYNLSYSALTRRLANSNIEEVDKGFHMFAESISYIRNFKIPKDVELPMNIQPDSIKELIENKISEDIDGLFSEVESLSNRRIDYLNALNKFSDFLVQVADSDVEKFRYKAGIKVLFRKYGCLD